jgi:hypothetical protein
MGENIDKLLISQEVNIQNRKGNQKPQEKNQPD